jgi:hypothetical protein
MDYKNELEKIESQIETQKLEKVKLLERKRQLEEEKVNIVQELKELGIREDSDLETIIQELEAEIELGIEKCQNILKN